MVLLFQFDFRGIKCSIDTYTIYNMFLLVTTTVDYIQNLTYDNTIHIARKRWPIPKRGELEFWLKM